MVDMSKFHVQVKSGVAKRAAVYAGIPKGFKIYLAGLTSPAAVYFEYVSLVAST